ncbi:MAG: hypothetical protein HKN16_09760 [Saprospiraceae bacterium]|nr:hypothetical protein [Saprospiraceae bacterium]
MSEGVGKTKIGRPKGNQAFMHVHKLDQLNESEMFDCSALILDTHRPPEINRMLRQIRRMRYKNFYLKPVFLNPGKYPREITEMVDGILDVGEIEPTMKHVAEINTVIREVRSVTSKYSFSESTIVKTLQYLFTRKKELSPIRNRKNKLGYSFPYISNILPESDQATLLTILEKACDDGLLKKEIVDRINLCKNCEGSYHHFREVCAKCNSLNLTPVDLMHHFRCAYIGPSPDFKQGSKLVCPKCDKELRHIGIDYDKPSEIYECNDCHHQTQQAEMRASCVDCGTENELQYLTTRNVNKYSLTAYGEEIAEFGLQKMDIEKFIPVKDRRIVTPETWTVIAEQEILRQKSRTKGKVIKIVIDKSVFLPMNQRKREDLKKELLKELISYVRPFDTITSKLRSEMLVLMPEIKAEAAEKYIEVFQFNLQKVLTDNLLLEKNLIRIQMHLLTEELEFKDL